MADISDPFGAMIRHRRTFLATCALSATAGLFSLSGLAWLGGHFDFERVSQYAAKRYGPQTQTRVANWRDLIGSLKNLPEAEKVRKVNDFFNRRIDYLDDIDIWGQSDYWATPLEMLDKAKADCEDFAIAKYTSLLILDIPADKLRLTYVKAKIGGVHSTVSQAHMVLGYYPQPSEEPLILDNLLHDIRPASRRPDLTPVFSFNSEGLWVGGSPGGASGGSATARLSRWRDLLARMKAEGFD